jgi:DNA-binding NtrC family response regulator/predicted hydrocarbon binding protein
MKMSSTDRKPHLARPGDGGTAPGMCDIGDMLWIPEGGGGAWLGDQRVLLFYPSSYQVLARALLEDAGPEAARRAIMRVGYTAGSNSAALLLNRGNEEVDADSFAKALSMLSIVGVAQAGQIDVDIDAAQGRFRATISWTQSLDADFHLSNLGLSAEPVCHSLVGYLNAYASALVGVPVAFREVECQACGHEVCRVIGRTVADWGDEAAALHYTRPHELINRFAAGAGAANANDDPDLVGVSPGFTAAFQLVEQVAPTRVDVLFLGETGVGKELFARALHRISRRRDGPFVAVNCAALPDNLVEAELFGVERGAYTGATRSRAGRFERADGGTLFLDEIGTLSYASQSKLLRALQTREIERVGGERTQRVDVRVVAATNEELEAAVREGRFRKDLYFRLSTFPVRIPPLRERRDDIPLLIGHFLNRYKHMHGRDVSGLTTAALSSLLRHSYPGNVRELEQLIERAVILTPDQQPIDAAQLFFRPLAGPRQEADLEYMDTHATATAGAAPEVLSTLLDESWSLAQLSEAFVGLALKRSEGNVAQAARLLGVSRAQIDYRLRRRRTREAAR